MMWRPKFWYPVASGISLELERPMGLWNFSQDKQGGFKRASVPTVAASFTVSTMYLLTLALRFSESEYPDVEAMIEYMQEHPMEDVRFWPDQDITDTYFDILLVSPVHGEKFAPIRQGELSDYEAAITVIRADGSAWPALPYIPL